MLQELPFETYKRITGKEWGKPSEMAPILQQYGITQPAGSEEANIALQKKLLADEKTQGIVDSTGTVGITDSDAIRAKETESAADKFKKDYEEQQELKRLQTQKAIADLKISISGGVTTPATPELVKTFEQLREEKGISDLESQITAIRTEKTDLLAQYQAFKRKEPAGVSMGFAAGRISEEAQNIQDRIDFLTRQESSIIDNLNNKNKYIETVMNLTAKEYDIAKQEADGEFTKNYQIQQLYNTQANDAQKDAQTFLSSVSNMLSNSGVSWNKIDDAMKTQIYQQEIKAGWIPGTLETFARIKPKANLLATINGYDTSGQGITTFIYSDENGNPAMVQSVNNLTYREPKETGFTPTQIFDRELKLAKDFETYAKEARTAIRSITIIEEGYNEAVTGLKEGRGLNAQSQAVIIGFNKLLDPSSVVRESEYARTPEGQSLLRKIEGKAIQIRQGGAGMTLASLKEIRDMSTTLLAGYKEQLINFAVRTKNQADSIGADLSRVLTPDVIDFMNKELGIKVIEGTQADKNYIEWLESQGFKITP